MVVHSMKSWPEYFQAIKSGSRTSDIRSMKDRNFAVGDILDLREWDPRTSEYSGRELSAVVTHIISADHTPCALSSAVLERGYCVLSVQVVP